MKPQAKTCREECLVFSDCPKEKPPASSRPQPTSYAAEKPVLLWSNIWPQLNPPHTHVIPHSRLLLPLPACQHLCPPLRFLPTHSFSPPISGFGPPSFPSSLTPSASFAPHLFRQQSAFALCVVPHHDALQPLHLGSLPGPVSGFRMDAGAAEQRHQVNLQ